MFDYVKNAPYSLFSWSKRPIYRTEGLVHIFESKEDAVNYACMFNDNKNYLITISEVNLDTVPQNSYRDQVPHQSGTHCIYSPKYRLISRDIVKQQLKINRMHQVAAEEPEHPGVAI